MPTTASSICALAVRQPDGAFVFRDDAIPKVLDLVASLTDANLVSEAFELLRLAHFFDDNRSKEAMGTILTLLQGLGPALLLKDATSARKLTQGLEQSAARFAAFRDDRVLPQTAAPEGAVPAAGAQLSLRSWDR